MGILGGGVWVTEGKQPGRSNVDRVVKVGRRLGESTGLLLAVQSLWLHLMLNISFAKAPCGQSSF